MLAVDLGTTRTKAAYLAPGMREPSLVQFEDGRKFMPTYVYVPSGADPPVFGEAAEALIGEDPSGSIGVLKNHFGGRALRSIRVNGRRLSLQDVLTGFLAHLRKHVSVQVRAFQKAPPGHAVMTVRAGGDFPTEKEEMLTAAAKGAGFDSVDVVREAEAAATAWFAAQTSETTSVVVLDCGGGTVDWNWLERKEKRYRTLSAGGLNSGGQDVDLAVLDRLYDGMEGDDDAIGHISRHLPLVLARIAGLKETISNWQSAAVIDVEGRTLTVERSWIAEATRGRFVDRVVAEFAPFLEEVREQCARSSGPMPTVLLTGGASQSIDLRERLEQLNFMVRSCEHPDAACALGALIQVNAGRFKTLWEPPDFFGRDGMYAGLAPGPSATKHKSGQRQE